MTDEQETNHAFARSLSNAGLGTSHSCALSHGCDWEKIGEYRVPARGAWSTNMPQNPDGTVRYETYRCKRCGRTQSDEALYSFVPNVEVSRK